MRVLIACEYSGTVRDAFIRAGHHAVSCDLLDTDTPGPHYMGDIRDVLDREWDMMIAFPPCTDLSVSGAKHFAVKIADGRQQRALDFVQLLMNAPIDKIAIENPIGVISSKIRKPDQIIQPYHFGHEATKSTCLWLKGLPLLVPTNVVGKGNRHVTKSGKSLPEWYNLPPSVDRWKIRSKTFQGIAEAMASQWS
jgi:site-specific DNA-cytosine methylase